MVQILSLAQEFPHLVGSGIKKKKVTEVPTKTPRDQQHPGPVVKDPALPQS